MNWNIDPGSLPEHRTALITHTQIVAFQRNAISRTWEPWAAAAGGVKAIREDVVQPWYHISLQIGERFRARIVVTSAACCTETCTISTEEHQTQNAFMSD